MRPLTESIYSMVLAISREAQTSIKWTNSVDTYVSIDISKPQYRYSYHYLEEPWLGDQKRNWEKIKKY